MKRSATVACVLSAVTAGMLVFSGCFGKKTDSKIVEPPVMDAPFYHINSNNFVRAGYKFSVSRAELTPFDYIELSRSLFRLRVFTDGMPQLMLYPMTSPSLPWSTYYYKRKVIKTTIDEDGKGARRYIELEKKDKCPTFKYDQHIRDIGNNCCKITTTVTYDDPKADCVGAWNVLIEDGEIAQKGDYFVIDEEGKRHKFNGKSLSVKNPVACEFIPKRYGTGFAVRFEKGSFRAVTVSKQGKDIHGVFSLVEKRNGKPFSLIYDGGPKERRVDSPGTVNGTDFHRYGAVDYAYWDIDKNLLVNPSFESGARYWRLGTGYNAADKLREGVARTGRMALDAGSGIRTFAIPLKEKKDYVLSFYAKSISNDFANLRVTFIHPYGRSVPFPAPNQGYFKAPKNEWKRFVYKFKTPVNVAAFSIYGKGALLDDFQLEEGTEASPYQGNPYGLRMENDGIDPYFADVTKPINARLVLTGKAGEKGKLEIEVEDFFGRITHTSSAVYSIGESGVQKFSIPDSAFRYKGANVVKVKVLPKRGKSYTDYLRFSVFKFADGTALNRHLHEYSALSLHRRSQLNIPESTFRMMKATGIAPRCRSIQDELGVYPPEMAKAIVKRYTDIGGVTIGYVWADSVHSGFGTQLVNMLKERGFENPVKSPKLSDELLKALEEVTSIIVKNAPWCDVWIGPDEISGSWACARDSSGMSAARLLMAMHRGVKKGNPNATFICYSTFNNGNVARNELRNFFNAAKKIDPNFKFDAIDPHGYRRFYDEPGSDVDEDWSKTFALLDEFGYKHMVAYSFGGGYAYPFLMNPWNGIAPWAETGIKDGHGATHVPGYDLGWGERVASAMQLRYNLAAYKYAPRLRSNTNWDPKMLDGENPHAPNVATAAQTEMLGNARFIEDVRFYHGSRAYIFNDGSGNATAVFWRFTKDLEAGREQALTLSLPLANANAKYFDMMANEVAPKTNDDGSVELPLSNFPVYVRVPLGKAKVLADAFKNASVK